jgi:hypothetical protein
LTFALTNSDWMFSCLVDVRPTKSCIFYLFDRGIGVLWSCSHFIKIHGLNNAFLILLASKFSFPPVYI